MDDEKFIRSMLEDVKARFAVDSGRIYVCGHSMGSAMTQRAALAMPDIFTAAASNSGVVTGGFMGDFDTPGGKIFRFRSGFRWEKTMWEAEHWKTIRKQPEPSAIGFPGMAFPMPSLLSTGEAEDT